MKIELESMRAKLRLDLTNNSQPRIDMRDMTINFRSQVESVRTRDNILPPINPFSTRINFRTQLDVVDSKIKLRNQIDSGTIMSSI